MMTYIYIYNGLHRSIARFMPIGEQSKESALFFRTGVALAFRWGEGSIEYKQQRHSDHVA